ncbi:MAG: hypothetical protein MZV63_52280 [Marinilabiliales bacterium]|nr:hypothetical protein [Marinilabiliales bacterium]
MSADDVKNIEKEFSNDRTKIGKLSFTEDWFFYPAASTVEKKSRSQSPLGMSSTTTSAGSYAFTGQLSRDVTLGPRKCGHLVPAPPASPVFRVVCDSSTSRPPVTRLHRTRECECLT